MAEMRISFQLSDHDVKHLRRMMRRAASAAREKPRASIVGAARVMAEEVRRFQPPEYVVQRAGQLERMIDMIEDEEWRTPQNVQRKILNALAYFAQPDDLVPDPIPGLGFLDDAILIELVGREMRHELDGFRDYRAAIDKLEGRRGRLGDAETDRRRVEARRRFRSRVQERQHREAAQTAKEDRVW